jgi:hypothetical protein
VLSRRVGAALALSALAWPRAGHAQAAPPSAHEDDAFDVMNVLTHHGLHDIDDERWNAYGQSTVIGQYKPSFAAPPYSGANSLSRKAEGSFTTSVTLFLGVKLWPGGEAYVVPEVIAEQPLSGLHGIGGAIQNFELQKTGSTTPQLYRSRSYLRQTFGLGGGTEPVESQPMQLATKVDKRRVVFTVGNFTILDVFDKNSVSWDPRQDFLNMAFMTYAAWDFPSDARGYSWGGAEELIWDDWALRLARITPPQSPNQLAIDFRIWEYYGDELELEHDHTLLGQPGAVRVVGYRNHVFSGGFADAISVFQHDPNENGASCGKYGFVTNYTANPNAPDLCYVRKANVKLGVGLSVEQHIAKDVGVFARGMYSDGQTEVDAFNSADRSLSIGAAAKGTLWHRHFDVAGAGFGMSWISQVHADFLALGGVDGFIGDGRLTHVAGEGVVEAFYSVNLLKAMWLTADYQLLWNPAYNADRGPLSIFGGRFHAEF